jgi:hypothetical protein
MPSKQIYNCVLWLNISEILQSNHFCRFEFGLIYGDDNYLLNIFVWFLNPSPYCGIIIRYRVKDVCLLFVSGPEFNTFSTRTSEFFSLYIYIYIYSP